MPSISAGCGATAGARRSSASASPSSISAPAAAARPRPASDAKAWRRRERARRARCGRSSTPPAPPPATGAPGPESCDLGPARAPQLVDLQLGMTVDDVRRRFPGVEVQSPKKTGLQNLKLEADDLARLPSDDPAFAPS